MWMWREFLTLVVLPDPLPRQLSGSVRDRPKSQILIWQSLLINTLPAWLEVTVDDISKMERFQGTQHVVQYKLNMAFCQARLSAHLDNLSKVRLLMLHNEKDMDRGRHA